MEKLINVALYGDGSRSTRLRAEYIYCDHAEECSAYREGKCFRVTTLFNTRCEYGRVEYIDGGTKRAKRYGEVYSNAQKNPKYRKLDYPYYAEVIRIGNGAFLLPRYIRIEQFGESLSVSDPGFGQHRLFVSKEILTPKNLKCICAYRPHSMMCEEIKDYQKKVVPMFLRQLSNLFPKEYESFIQEYPEYRDKPADWVGRQAFLSTCNRDMEYRDWHGNVFLFNGDEIVCKNYQSSFLPFGVKEVELRLKVTEDMIVKITDNSQVVSQTVFK